MTDYGVWDGQDTENYHKFFRVLINFLKTPAPELRQELAQIGQALGSIGEYAYQIWLNKGLNERLELLLAGDKTEWSRWLWAVWASGWIPRKLRPLSPFAGKKLIFVSNSRYGHGPRDFHLEAYCKDLLKVVFRKWEKRIEELPIFDKRHQKWAIILSSTHQLEETILLERR